MAYLHNRISLIYEKGGDYAIWDNIDGDWGHFLKEIVRQRKTNPVWS